MADDSMELLLQNPTATCTNCRREISVDMLYVCASGHDICSSCTFKLTRCILCLKKISDNPHLLCTYHNNGCNYKAPLCDVKYHETDCDYKEYACPLKDNGCEEEEIAESMSLHLMEHHMDKIVIDHCVTGDLPRKDKYWIIIAFGKVFKCYLWIYEFHVEWLLKFVGPQRHASDYSYVLKLYKPDNANHIFRSAAICTGFRTFSLDKCISIPVTTLELLLSKGPVQFHLEVCSNASQRFEFE